MPILVASRRRASHKFNALAEQLREFSNAQMVVLLDNETNTKLDNLAKPLSHAGLVKLFLEKGELI